MMVLLHRQFRLWGLSLLLVCVGQTLAASTQEKPVQAQPLQQEAQGLSFYVLRVIYPETEKKGVTLTAYNKTDLPYLMQSRIWPVEAVSGNVDMSAAGNEKAMPFIVTPPLARLGARSDLTLRIRRNGEPLPSDRESVFFISMKAIPRQAAPEARAPDLQQMVLTVVSNIKVFYRPDGLAKRAVVDAAPQLRFKREGNRLIADNPTPYWLTFSRLKVGTASLDKAQLRLMVPPKGRQHYLLPAGATGAVSWQLIDEDGWDTPVQQSPL
jgi:P pilus assembly chaperone PapD